MIGTQRTNRQPPSCEECENVLESVSFGGLPPSSTRGRPELGWQNVATLSVEQNFLSDDCMGTINDRHLKIAHMIVTALENHPRTTHVKVAMTSVHGFESRSRRVVTCPAHCLQFALWRRTRIGERHELHMGRGCEGLHRRHGLTWISQVHDATHSRTLLV